MSSVQSYRGVGEHQKEVREEGEPLPTPLQLLLPAWVLGGIQVAEQTVHLALLGGHHVRVPKVVHGGYAHPNGLAQPLLEGRGQHNTDGHNQWNMSKYASYDTLQWVF